MRKDLGVLPVSYPMPVLMVATYNEDGTVNVMNVAWGGICTDNMVALNIRENRRTMANIKAMKAFTVSVADIRHLAEADFFGMVSGSKVPDKFERTGLHQVKSSHVNAPIIEEFPIALECKLSEIQQNSYGPRVIGEIVNVSVKEEVIDEHGKVDPAKIEAAVFDPFQNGYYRVGEKVGRAWFIGSGYMDRKPSGD